MKICILESYERISKGYIKWDYLDSVASVTKYDYTSVDEIYERCYDADIILLSKTVIPNDILRKLTKLKMISVLATGYNNVNTELCRELGITVCNVPAYSTDSVSQLIISYILYFCNRVDLMNDSVKKGDWVKSLDFCYLPFHQVELTNKNIGFIGYGKIAKRTCNIAKALGMNTYTYSRNKYSDIENVSLDELLRICDFVCLTCPLTSETSNMVNKDFLLKMKKSSYLINTSRGGLVVDEDLAYALKNNTIKGAAIDVISVEPPKKDNPLLSLDNIIITPHVAWGSNEAFQRLIDITKNNIFEFINGTPINVVN